MESETDLRFRQAAGRNVEESLKQMLFDFAPTQALKVSDVLFIARTARSLAFDAFRKPV